MKTEIFVPSEENYEKCGRLIRSGELVAFPTETVYGLGANALDPEAVKKVYLAKGRPSDNPLIVHIASPDDIDKVARSVPDKARLVIEKFMPGSVTVVMPKRPEIPDCVTGGLDTVAVRMPLHPVALEFIRACGVPICAPSANTSTRPSPTLASHVYDDLGGKIAAILDGGACSVGVESTVIDFVGDTPRLLRAGGMPLEPLEEVVGKIQREVKSDKPLCPGMKYKHYAPSCDVTVVMPGSAQQKKAAELYDKFVSEGKKTVIMTLEGHIPAYGDRNVFNVGKDSREYAHNLFSLLRECDKEGFEAAVAEGVTDEGYGLSVMNRVCKSAGGKIIG
ncbi:MAG: L-threonylcarbamoyladenylate synthase [Firmicutes bacterium]|nr:L-threonylcarbamoyladenylate synthase [Bacillota bacterium]MDY5531902.1 L-threonylcarbamoyladenylate synthase [Pumilibacteraceae bacterium]